ncbi:class I SAM-dependent methyltransferase [Alteriqipengyuania sp. WL0013]|uniref:class I SAM-dependent methyltransferase n=1 Tax=Alteriqipengyuania sp. WL0013 TaxID=3110773 RepID=UPI002BCEAFC5|nr:class I SAM-dependent methyltransferase [Alteriqipengyuania sp. WL0013]MEB3414507.1 class I SAM-dependent methyltransferase [Alteriqipengyuania sp. WL0013]
MTSREKTTFMPRSDREARPTPAERALVAGWATIQWPWLLKSLWGGRKADKAALLDRLGLAQDALPHLGSWKADTIFLKRIVDHIEQAKPAQVVELGCGATSLIIGKALERYTDGGRVDSYDQHGEFCAATGEWLAANGLDPHIHHAPLAPASGRWASHWYDMGAVPDRIDMLVIDGPVWTFNPFIRGSAERLFERIPVGGVILLDDGARPGERMVANRWRKAWPDFRFDLLPGPAGTLRGERIS